MGWGGSLFEPDEVSFSWLRNTNTAFCGMIIEAIQLLSKGARDIAKLSHSPTVTDGWNSHCKQFGVQPEDPGIELLTF